MPHMHGRIQKIRHDNSFIMQLDASFPLKLSEIMDSGLRNLPTVPSVDLNFLILNIINLMRVITKFIK